MAPKPSGSSTLISAPEELNADHLRRADQKLPDGYAKGIKVLHLFSGPAGRVGGFSEAVTLLGGTCEDWDTVNGPEEDLGNDATWQRILRRIQTGEFQAVLAGPPCSTFSRARRVDPWVPAALGHFEDPGAKIGMVSRTWSPRT